MTEISVAIIGIVLAVVAVLVLYPLFRGRKTTSLTVADGRFHAVEPGMVVQIDGKAYRIKKVQHGSGGSTLTLGGEVK